MLNLLRQMIALHEFRGCRLRGAAALIAATLAGPAYGQEADLAKKLSNPVAAMISVPFQFNYDGRIGYTEKGERSTLNIQPVVPIHLNSEWNLISRTILPIISRRKIALGSDAQFGTGDITQSLFLSPAKPGRSGIIWGIGPVFHIPTASDELLGTGRWGAGPTAVVLKQEGPWTFGALANHVWSFGGATRGGVSAMNVTFLQPFISYTTPDAWTFSLNSEATYDWVSSKLTVPINAQIAKLIKVGGQPISLFAGARYYLSSPQAGPKGFGLRAGITFLFPT